MTNFKLRTFDLPSLNRHAIGFDRMLDDIFGNIHSEGNYPPYNIARLDETHYVIEVAVAGFKENEISVELKDRVLMVSGKQEVAEEAKENVEYLFKGIGTRNFERVFNLAENIEVRAATVENGILAVALEHVIPEEQKPKRIAISFKK